MNRVFPATVEASLRIIKGTARLGFDATAKYINSRLLPPLSTPMIQRGRHFDERNLGANKIDRPRFFAGMIHSIRENELWTSFSLGFLI